MKNIRSCSKIEIEIEIEIFMIAYEIPNLLLCFIFLPNFIFCPLHTAL